MLIQFYQVVIELYKAISEWTGKNHRDMVVTRKSRRIHKAMSYDRSVYVW